MTLKKRIVTTSLIGFYHRIVIMYIIRIIILAIATIKKKIIFTMFYTLKDVKRYKKVIKSIKKGLHGIISVYNKNC